jgi:hypothetical protein
MYQRCSIDEPNVTNVSIITFYLQKTLDEIHNDY